MRSLREGVVGTFQVKYWFDSNSRDRTGEQIIETIQEESIEAVARRIEANLGRPAFTIVPSFGVAQGGLVVIHSPLVRFVELLPAGNVGP
jgi:hypothetical protein